MSQRQPLQVWKPNATDGGPFCADGAFDMVRHSILTVKRRR